MTGFTLVGLIPATEYCVVIYAVNAAGYSGNPSEQVCATTSVS
jgi:Interferon-alpha/beta receptor, fibronectin type III